jgi:hypothetical protein
MKNVLNITQKFISILMVLLSALAIYKGNIGIAIYLVLVALYVNFTVNITILIPEKEDKENE